MSNDMAGLDFEKAEDASNCSDASGKNFEAEYRAELNRQHLAALAHARAEAKREAVEEIVKAVREWGNARAEQYPASSVARELRGAADVIAARFGRET